MPLYLPLAARHLCHGDYRRSISTNVYVAGSDTVNLVRRQLVREALPQRAAGLVAEMAMIGVTVEVGKIVPANQFRRTAGKQRSDDRMLVRIVAGNDFGQRLRQQVTDRNTLADVQIAERVDVQAVRVSQIWVNKATKNERIYSFTIQFLIPEIIILHSYRKA